MLNRVVLPDEPGRDGGFPFDIPALQGLEALELTTSVTFLVGENGSGKSTFLEALAAATGLPTVGSQSANRDPTLGPQRRLGKAMRLSWRKKIHCGFFLRGRDFFGFAKRLAEMRKEFQTTSCASTKSSRTTPSSLACWLVDQPRAPSPPWSSGTAKTWTPTRTGRGF